MKISVVTVVKDDSNGLLKTLESLKKLRFKPFEVIVKDFGGGELEMICKGYRNYISIVYINSCDLGIYDAMNQAKAHVSGDLIHYLNAGDSVYGEPYERVSINTYLPVKLELSMRFLGYAKFGLGGRMYCHQGLFFPPDHKHYCIEYEIAADLELIMLVFPGGLNNLIRSNSGGVIFDKSGVSSTKKIKRDLEYIKILYKRNGLIAGLIFAPKLIYTLTIGRGLKWLIW